jgi:hypothetical protein
MRKAAIKNVAKGKGHACRPFAELTCSEGQVEEMLSAGESSEQEHQANKRRCLLRKKYHCAYQSVSVRMQFQVIDYAIRAL